MQMPETTDPEQFWHELYSAHDQVWSGRPNAVLAEVAGGLAPGTALDLGCGEGGDAVWLAARGWRVTAVDISTLALERLTAAAAAAGVADRVKTERHDFASSFPAGTFDLVSAQFLQTPLDFPRDEVLRGAAAAVAPGGLLLVVSHGSMPSWAWGRHGHHEHEQLPTPASELATLGLDPELWRTERADQPERETTGPEGQQATILDTVVALRRLPT